MKRLCLLVIAATALTARSGAAETVSLLDKPIPVTETVGPFDKNGMSATINIGTYRIETALGSEVGFADLGEALDVGRKQIHWQPPYLLVESVTSWKHSFFNRTWVFKIEHDRPKLLGRLGGGADLKDRRFVSLYNKEAVWDSLGFACQACKSHLHIILHADKDTLIPDGEATWRVNRPIWRDNEEAIRSGLAKGEPSGDEDTLFRWRQDVERALIENAALAAYCGRADEVRRLKTLALKHLDSALRKDFEKSQHNVIALEPPEHWTASRQGP